MAPPPTRIVLRAFAEADLPDFLAYQGRPSVREHQRGDALTETQAAAFVAEQARRSSADRDAWHGRVIVHVADRRVIGDLGVWLPAERNGPLIGDLGFQLAPAYQGRGYAREAVQAFLHIAFRDLGVTRLTASCDEANVASWGLMERLGMRLHDRDDGRREYALTRAQWTGALTSP